MVGSKSAAACENLQGKGRGLSLMHDPQHSLKMWGKQNWRTKSGKKSSVTGERYLPEAAIKSLSSAEYAATTAAKMRDKKTRKAVLSAAKKHHGENAEVSLLD
jgi:predicted metal-dependent phosphoesterase TrpH